MRPQSRFLRLLASTILASLSYSLAAAAAAPDGQWPMRRHDPVLSACQPLPGDMRQPPRVLAKYFVGAEQGTATFADLRGTGKKEDVIIAARRG